MTASDSACKRGNVTHESYLSAIVAAVTAYAPQHADQLRAAKVVYGTGHGQPHTLGTTHHGAWRNGKPEAVALVEVCAFAQDAPSQIAATAVHELAHAIVGPGHGHGAAWKRAARALGLVKPLSTSDGCDTWDAFAPPLRQMLEALPVPTDGRPLPPAPRSRGRARLRPALPAWPHQMRQVQACASAPPGPALHPRGGARRRLLPADQRRRPRSDAGLAPGWETHALPVAFPRGSPPTARPSAGRCRPGRDVRSSAAAAVSVPYRRSFLVGDDRRSTAQNRAESPTAGRISLDQARPCVGVRPRSAPAAGSSSVDRPPWWEIRPYSGGVGIPGTLRKSAHRQSSRVVSVRRRPIRAVEGGSEGRGGAQAPAHRPGATCAGWR